MEVAKTILAQLGGSRFIAMTGAKDMMHDDKSLHFKIGKGATNKANKVVVKLNANDLYTIQFWNIRGVKCVKIEEIDGVFAGDLQRIFTAKTGMLCKL